MRHITTNEEKVKRKIYPSTGLDLARGLEEVEVPRIFRQSSHLGGKVGRPTHRPPLFPQEICLVLISLRGWGAPMTIVRPWRLNQWNISKIPSKIEPATITLVAQCLNKLHDRVPHNEWGVRRDFYAVLFNSTRSLHTSPKATEEAHYNIDNKWRRCWN